MLLSLHPPMVLANLELSAYTRDGLAELHQFEKLVLEPGACDHTDLQDWLNNLPTNYPGQLGDTLLQLVHVPSYHGLVPHPHLQDDGLQDPRCHHSHLLLRIHPGVGLAPGGLIHRARQEVELFLEDMETVADLMAERTSWNLPQYAILKEMHHDLKKMHYSFRNNRQGVAVSKPN